MTSNPSPTPEAVIAYYTYIRFNLARACVQIEKALRSPKRNPVVLKALLADAQQLNITVIDKMETIPRIDQSVLEANPMDEQELIVQVKLQKVWLTELRRMRELIIDALA